MTVEGFRTYQIKTVKLLHLLLAHLLNILQEPEVAHDGLDFGVRLAGLSADLVDGGGRRVALVVEHDDPSAQLGKVADSFVALHVSGVRRW
jgi:hypothetical protein